MKKVIFLLLLNSLLMFNCALAFPTVRQVMDFEIGDMFHYQFQTVFPPTVQYYIESQEVIGKQYYPDSTGVTYQFKRIRYERETPNGRWCDVLTETFTRTYTNLDSSCISLYPVYCAQNPIPLNISSFTYSQQTNSIYQGRTLVDGKIDNENYVTCVVGLGFVAYDVQNNNIRNLVWYKKGNETYGTPITYLQNGYDLYANVLTRGDVYDFEVGDVIQMSVHDLAAMSYNYTYQVSYNILSKTQTNPSSLLYTALRKRQWVEGDTIDFYFSQDTISLSYGTLNTYIGMPCNVGVHYKCDSLLENTVTIDFPTTFTNHTYIKGVGHFYTERGYGGSYYEHEETPTYWFKAAENKSCGTFFTFDSLSTDSLLRKREVFDFAEGDEFQFERQYKNPTSSTYMVGHKILAKTETNTEWTYKVQRKQQFIAGDTLGFYTKLDTIEQVYNKLDDWVAPISNLFPKTYNLCEPLLANYYNNFPLNTANSIKNIYIKGLGVYRDSASHFQEQLTYYHKVSGNTTCGNYFNFALPDTIPPAPPTALIAYYIPNDNAIKVQIPENEGTSVIEIINFQGQRIYQIEVAPKKTEISIAAQTLESQIYIVRLLTGEKQSYQKISVIK